MNKRNSDTIVSIKIGLSLIFCPNALISQAETFLYRSFLFLNKVNMTYKTNKIKDINKT